MKRKEFLQLSAALTGLALLAPGCKRPKPMPGGIVGASAAIGHLVRDKSFGPPVSYTDCEVAIVGGGISGLSAARWLHKHGVTDIRILDLEKKMGGNAAYGQNAVSAYPWGAHYVPIPNPGLNEYLAFLEESGVITGYDEKGLPVFNEYHLCFDPQERLYIDGHWQDGLVPGPGLPQTERKEIERFLQDMDRLRNIRGNDGREAFAIPVDRSSKDPLYTALDEITMQEWLDRNGYRSPRLHWYVDYCTRDDFGTRSNRISAWTGIHYFAGRKGVGANAKRDDVLTWPEGNGWLASKLIASFAGGPAAVTNGAIMPNALVIRIIPGPQQVEVHYLDVPTKQVLALRAGQIVMAVPQFVANRLLPQDKERHQLVQDHLSYAPWMVANLTIKPLEERTGQPLSWDNVLYDSPSLGYVEATHQQLGQLKERLVLTYYRPLTEDEPSQSRQKAQQRSHEEWCKWIFVDLQKVHPDIVDKTEHVDIMLWGHAMAQPKPGWIHGPVRQTLQTSKDPRIHFAHTDLAGISIFEEGFYQGLGAAEKILQAARPSNSREPQTS